MGMSAVAVGTLAAGYLSSQATQGAANTQAGAGQAAIAGQQQMLASQQAIQAPYVSAGQQALNQLISGTQPGGQFTQQFQMNQLPQYQAPSQGLQAYQPSNQALPGFQQPNALPGFQPFNYQGSDAQTFATKTAMDAMRNQMEAGGQALSTNAITGAGKLASDIGSQYEQQAYNQWLGSQGQQFQQALAGSQLGLAAQGQQFGQAVTGQQLGASQQAQQFTQGLAGQQLSAAQQAQQYNQALTSQQQAQNVYQMNLQNQLAPLQYLTGIGQASASGQAANIGAAGSNIANLQTGIGNAQAAGQIGSANAIGGAVNNLGQMYMLQSMLGK
jgi:hypothetical protein